ncbi:hypothetical protein FA95DRAFT_937030 [Auriscalpium vulgare]|uniref:Uncharacterized protein n=1 Tax=Auriscalpium vulgare TaxID=40419 RepID=A0ACB8S9J9_9AGAM|nr:hypothetical protein FA95DRAFT_937030 [Auriscalpium vulgare]
MRRTAAGDGRLREGEGHNPLNLIAQELSSAASGQTPGKYLTSIDCPGTTAIGEAILRLGNNGCRGASTARAFVLLFAEGEGPAELAYRHIRYARMTGQIFCEFHHSLPLRSSSLSRLRACLIERPAFFIALISASREVAFSVQCPRTDVCLETNLPPALVYTYVAMGVSARGVSRTNVKHCHA